MKPHVKIIFQLMLFVITSICTQAQTIYPCGVSGCIARWTFDTIEVSMLDTLPDMSGNNNPGSVTDITSVSGFRNKLWAAGGFNGTSSFAEVVNKSVLNSTNVSILSLVNFNSFNPANCQGNQILSKGYPYFTPGNYGQGLCDNFYDGSCSIYTPDHTQLITQCGNTSFTTSPSFYIDTNKWYFFASVITSNEVRQYQVEMDSLIKVPSIAPINTLTIPINIGTNSQSITIGKHLNPLFQYYLNGKIDEIILFERALNTSEIYSIYEYLWGAPSKNSDLNEVTKQILITCANKTIDIKSENKYNKIEVINNLGQIIFKKDVFESQSEISLPSCSKQILFVKLTDIKGNLISKKILLQ